MQGPEPEDVLLFTGSGSTAAVCKMVHLLGLRNQWAGAGSGCTGNERRSGSRRHHCHRRQRRQRRRGEGLRGQVMEGVGGMESDGDGGESIASVSAAGDSPSSQEEEEEEAEADLELESGSEGEGANGDDDDDDDDDRPVVFACPIGHHSNLLPWRESGAEVVPVRADGRVGVDLRHLEELLRRYRRRRLKVGRLGCVVFFWFLW